MRMVVIGGGIGGLTAAIALTRVGIDTHLYEQAAGLREVGAGIALATNALYALGILGLADEIKSHSIRALQGGLREPGGDTLVSLPGGDVENQIGIVAVMHRAELLDVLARRLESRRLHLGRRCIAVHQDGAGVTVHFNTGETVSADGIVAADGLRSTVRTQLFGQTPVLYAGYTAWRAVVKFPGRRDVMIGETWGRGCRFGIVPMSDDRVYWFATMNTPPDQQDGSRGTKNILTQLFRGWHQPIEALIAAAAEESILRNDIYDLDPPAHFAHGRIALLGDAAHAMTPNLGQGACQAIEDAVVLAACLKAAGEVQPALLEYERRRMPRTRKILLWSRRFGTVAQLQNPLVSWFRNSVIRLTPTSATRTQIKALLEYPILTTAEEALFVSQSS